jgi:transmembrane protein 231
MRIQTDYITWSSQTNDGFKINTNIRYDPVQIYYTPAFWEQFKWGWIQYISVLIPFIYIFYLIKIFIFNNNLVDTVVLDHNYKIKSD